MVDGSFKEVAPEEMRKMSIDEGKDYLAKKAAERGELQKRIADSIFGPSYKSKASCAFFGPDGNFPVEITPG